MTSSERLPRWFLSISGQLESGGRDHLEGNAGGVINACTRPSLLAVTWEYAGDVSWVEARISDDGAGRAHLTLRHTAHHSGHWCKFGPGAVGVGWELGLLRLGFHIERPLQPILDEAVFAESPEGKAFITSTSESWGQEAVAVGTDPDAASEAARRATKFYTGESA